MQRFHRFAFVSLALGVALLAGCGGSDNKNPASPPPTLELNSGTLGNGAQYAHTFKNPGTYPYHCTIHSNMTASITVDPASTVSVLAISITDFAFTPSTTTVDTGAVVTWTNNGASNHTVTSH